MKLTRLDNSSGTKCYLVKFRKTTFLLDCGLSTKSILDFCPRRLPAAKECFAYAEDVGTKMTSEAAHNQPVYEVCALSEVDLESVDAILISDFTEMLALPYITELSHFRGNIYATEPTVALARQACEELLAADQALRLETLSTISKRKRRRQSNPQDAPQVASPSTSRAIFSRDEMLASLSKVSGVHYSQDVSIAGGLLKATAFAGGLHLGSASWVIEGGGRKLVYMGSASLVDAKCCSLDRNPLRFADALLLSSVALPPPPNQDRGTLSDVQEALVRKPSLSLLSQPPTPASQDRHSAFKAIPNAVTDVVRDGGNVLLPVGSGDLVHELIDEIASALKAARLEAKPLYFVSPAAQRSIAHASINMEWMTPAQRDKVYDKASAPYDSTALAAEGRLRLLSDLQQLPAGALTDGGCVIFTAALSVRAGPTAQVLRAWGADPSSLLVVTEPLLADDCALLEATNHLCGSFRMQLLKCVVDRRPTPFEIMPLLRYLKPRTLAVPSELWEALLAVPAAARASLGTEDTVAIPPRERVSVSLPARAVPVAASSALALQVQLTELPGTSEGHRGEGSLRVSRVSANLSVRDGSFALTAPDPGATAHFPKASRLIWGQLTLDGYARALKEQNFDAVTICAVRGEQLPLAIRESTEEDGALVSVTWGHHLGKVWMTANATHIVSNQPVLRFMLQEALFTQLHVL
ncbi:hypothetical protein CYMTET_49558 [Cymbomonas tetramitiformis]|uniref:Beta-Casp domain-containing protein n=1 Tax=Cymbomonas tetramitiformis TaxID=36881 RepID=A0AAE0EU09_9CHLO|nr:hypothetical protein CYMTET_49558 [Cymbomonas tetramitiformis]|eukprot:gene8888-10532_t